MIQNVLETVQSAIQKTSLKDQEDKNIESEMRDFKKTKVVAGG